MTLSLSHIAEVLGKLLPKPLGELLARTRAVELNPEAEAAEVPAEAGGEGAASLFDASGDARVRILRVDERTQKRVTHGYFPATVNEEDVSAAFGGGNYRAQLIVPDPTTGQGQIRRTRDFSIPGAYRPPQKINTIDDVSPHGAAATPAAAAAAASAMPVVPGGGDDLMQVLKAGIINTVLELMKASKDTRATGPDPLLIRLMESQAQTQQQMMQFMLTLATKDSGDKDMLAMLVKMKEIVAPTGNTMAAPTNPMEMFNTMLETFSRMREVADDISPAREPGDPLMESIPKLVEVVAEQHQLQKAARTAVTGTRRVAGPAGGTAELPVVGRIEPKPQQQPQPQPENLAMWQIILRQQAARLVAFATAKQDPDDIAAMAIIFAPANVKEALAIFFHRDEESIVADILTEVPQLAEHREWMGDFIQACQERLFPEEFSDADDEPEQPGGGD